MKHFTGFHARSPKNFIMFELPNDKRNFSNKKLSLKKYSMLVIKSECAPANININAFVWKPDNTLWSLISAKKLYGRKKALVASSRNFFFEFIRIPSKTPSTSPEKIINKGKS